VFSARVLFNTGKSKRSRASGLAFAIDFAHSGNLKSLPHARFICLGQLVGRLRQSVHDPVSSIMSVGRAKMQVAQARVLSVTLKSTLGRMASLGLVIGCGGDATNPEAVDVTDLKNPYGLSLQDQGNGKVKLSWRGSNNESDFSG